MPGANCKLPTFAKRKRKVRNWDGFVQRCREATEEDFNQISLCVQSCRKTETFNASTIPGITNQVVVKDKLFFSFSPYRALDILISFSRETKSEKKSDM